MLAQCQVSNHGVLYTNFDMSGKSMVIDATVYDDNLTLGSIPEQHKRCFIYFILHRYYADNNNALASYYSSLYEQQKAKVFRKTVRVPETGIGSDL